MIEFKPTMSLRWLERPASLDAENSAVVKTLQQWFAPFVPAYVADPTVGEWRDVPLVEGAP